MKGSTGSNDELDDRVMFFIYMSIFVWGSYEILLMEEILQKVVSSASRYLQGFIHPRWLAAFLPSTLCLHNIHNMFTANL